MPQVKSGTDQKVRPAFKYCREEPYQPTFETGFNVQDLFGTEDGSRTCVVVGSGPSLVDFPWENLRDGKIFTMAINDELRRSEGKYKPDFWVFHDPQVFTRHRKYDVPEDVKIISRQQCCSFGLNLSLWPDVPIPSWLHRVYTYKPSASWNMAFEDERLLIRRTTATVCITLAVRMGFKKIILIGQDLYSTGGMYYYDGQKPRDVKRKNTAETRPGIFHEERHARMLADYVALKVALDAGDWDGEIVQTSIHSPLSCFTKKPWEQAFTWART